jgi:hypothetical protein
MTTTVTIKALHNWPVTYTGVDPKTGEPISGYAGRVEPGASLDVICHSTMDLRIHEVQPGEDDAEKAEAAEKTDIG